MPIIKFQSIFVVMGRGIWIVGIVLGFFTQCTTHEPQNISTHYEIDTPFYFGDYSIPLDNPMTEEGIALGRKLFYEKKLSGDNSMSCATCHDQKFAFASDQRFQPGINGSAVDVNTPSLANILWNNRLFWNGRSESIEESSLNAVENPLEMDQKMEDAITKLENAGYQNDFLSAFGTAEINESNMQKAMSQFLRTLVSANSRYDRYLRDEISFSAAEVRGEALFFTHPDPSAGVRGGNCGDCHSNFLTNGFRTGFDGFHNNGLDTDENLKPGLHDVTGNENDFGKFKTPTLRNISLTAPYMHDGRFNFLMEVLDHYNEHIQKSKTLDVLILEASNEIPASDPIMLHLSEQEKSDIIAFLLTLTDDTFLTNENLSTPF